MQLHHIHFLLRSLLPEVIPILLVNLQGVFDGLWDTNSKLVGLLMVPRVDLGGNNVVPYLHCMWNPPSKCWLIPFLACNGIFCHFNRVTLLNAWQALPGCWLVTLFDTDFPSFNCLPLPLPQFIIHVFLTLCYRVFICLVINNSLGE